MCLEITNCSLLILNSIDHGATTNGEDSSEVGGSSSNTGVSSGAIVRSNSPIVIKDDKVFYIGFCAIFLFSSTSNVYSYTYIVFRWKLIVRAVHLGQ